MAEITSERDLVVALAEGVMGWKLLPYDANIGAQYSLPKPLYLVHSDRAAIFIRKANGDYARDWNPLESIADAWMLVEAMRKLHGCWLFSIDGIDRSPACAAAFHSPSKYARMEGDTAPRAICLAAAAALGLEVRLG